MKNRVHKQDVGLTPKALSNKETAVKDFSGWSFLFLLFYKKNWPTTLLLYRDEVE